MACSSLLRKFCPYSFYYQNLLSILVCPCVDGLSWSYSPWPELGEQGCQGLGWSLVLVGEAVASLTASRVPAANSFCCLFHPFPQTNACSIFALKREGVGGPLWGSRRHRDRWKKGWRGSEMKPQMGFYSDIRELAHPGCCAKSGLKKKSLTFKIFSCQGLAILEFSLATLPCKLTFFAPKHCKLPGRTFCFFSCKWIYTAKWVLTLFGCLFKSEYSFLFFDKFQEITQELCTMFEWSILRLSFLLNDWHVW